LTTLDRKPVQLSKQLADGPVVLVVLRGWPGYQCPICTRQVGEFIAQAEQLQAAKARVMLVYPGPADHLMDHAEEFVSGKDIPANFSFVIDPDFKFTVSYGLRWDGPRETAYPSAFVIDPKGVVRFAKVSKTHGDRASAKEVLAVVAGIKEKKDEPPLVDVGVESASHREVTPLTVQFKSLSALRLDRKENLLACDEEAKEIRVLDPSGKQVAVMKPPVAPEAIDVASDGTIYCGGEGRLVKLDQDGKVLKTASIPESAGPSVSAPRRATATRLRLSGIAVTDEDVFIAFGIGWHLGAKAKLFRFDRDLGQPKMLAEGLRGCCQRCDIVAGGGVVYVAENAAHRVVLYDREGKVLGKWGEKSRDGLEGFGSCCNPMNLWLDAHGVLYTAESGLGRVKRYTTDGKFLGLVGYVGVDRFQSASQLAASCSNLAIAVTPDGDRVYLVDVKHSLIRVLQKKG
jgi:peroxiredoxin